MQEFYVDPQESMPKNTTGRRVVVMFLGSEIRRLSSVIVETWDKVVTPGERAGTKHRKWCEEFTLQERRFLGQWHNRMHVWEMRTGHPQEIGMTLMTHALLTRAANFFADV